MKRKTYRITSHVRTRAADHPSNTFVRIVRKVRPSVVSIVTESQSDHETMLQNHWLRMFLPELNVQRETVKRHFGSGFFIHPAGYVLTNEHVVNNTSAINVYTYRRQKAMPGKVVWRDSERDLAILKLPLRERAPVCKLGSSATVEVGEFVMAVGNPLGLNQTATLGVISGLNRQLQASGRDYGEVLQTDAAINPGNSGGPLVNVLGEVIGINAAIIYPSQSIGFAIPIDHVKPYIAHFLP
ncbi:S1C family serine protease [Numidum massiliense]|uniref:S1C family serine protease n=1 Tax=Numidum massiliense TaxID=1522315 RepID=UPI0006D5B3DE|nr:trypsin-like peptidase domain-containing protein [Numidum massiliense]